MSSKANNQGPGVGTTGHPLSEPTVPVNLKTGPEASTNTDEKKGGSYRTLTRELIDKNKFNMTQLKEFDVDGLPENFAMVIYGIRRRGKTFLLRDMLYHLRKRFDRAFIFSSTADLQPEQYDFIPPENIYQSENTDKLVEIIEEQEMIIKQNQNKPKKEKTVLKTCIIFDDFIQDPKVARNNPALKGLYVRGRHCHISVISLVQSRTGIGPMVRENIDCVVCFEATNDDDRKMLMKSYLSSSDFGYKEGAAFFNSVTEKEFTALAVNTTLRGQREVYQRGFSYKVPAKQKKFLIGKKGQVKNQLIQIENVVDPNDKRLNFGHSAKKQEIKMKTPRMNFETKEVRSIRI